MLDLRVVATVHSGDLGSSAIKIVSWVKRTCSKGTTHSTVAGKAIICRPGVLWAGCVIA
jgi:hypothetical protein